jgi:putative transposase
MPIISHPTRPQGDLRRPDARGGRGQLARLSKRWSKTCTIAVRSWQNNWIDLATMLDYAPDIRRLIYSTNYVESYNSQLRRLLKTKSALPSAETVRKLLFLANRSITDRWTKAIANWPAILNQLAIRFDGRVPS